MSEISTSSSTTVLTPGEQQVVDELGNACKTNNGYSAWTTFRALFQRRHLSPKLGRVKPEDERRAFIFFFEAFRVGPRGGHDAEVAKEFNKLLLKLMERYQCDPLSNEGRVVLLQMDALYGSGSHESEPSSSALLDLLNLTHQYHRMGSGCASPRMIYPDYIVPPLPSQEMRVDNFRRLACWRGAQLDLYELLIEYMHQAIVASGCRDPEEKLAESSEASLWMSRAYHCAYQHVRQMQTLIQVYMREEAAESEVAELFGALNASVMMVIHWSSCGHQAIQQVEEASRLIFNSHLANFSECEWILAMYVYEVLAGRILALRQPTVGGISLTEERVVLRQQLAHPPSLMETSPVLRLGAFRTTFDAIRAAQAILRVSEAILGGEESRRWPTFLRAYLALISSNSVGTSSSSVRSDPARNAYGSVVAALCQPNQLLLQELPNLKWELLAVELS